MNYFQKAVAYIKTHWLFVTSLVAAVWAYASPTVLNFVTNHPKYSFAFGLAAMLVQRYWPQSAGPIISFPPTPTPIVVVQTPAKQGIPIVVPPL